MNKQSSVITGTNAECAWVPGHPMQKYVRDSVVFSGTILSYDLPPIEPQQVDFMFKPGSAWFFPEYRFTGVVADAVQDDDTYVFSGNTSGMTCDFKNRVAPVVYWLWRKIWNPIRWFFYKEKETDSVQDY